MAFIYSKRLGEFVYASPTSTVVYTVPSGFVAVLRSVDIVSFSSGATSLLVSRTGGAGFIFVESSAAGTDFTWKGRQVFNPGDTITVDAFSGAWQGLLSGYELLL